MGYVRDEKVRFLSVRDGRSWYYLRKWKGSVLRISLGRLDAISRKEAARRCEEISGNLIRCGNPDGVPAAAAGNAKLGDAWRCYCSQRTVSSRQRRQWEMYLAPRFGRREISSIRHADVRALHLEISGRYPVAANRVIALMSAVVNAAIRDDICSGPNPVGMIRKNRETPRRRYLGQTEKRKVLAGLEAAMRSPRSRVGAEALKMMLLTGARPGNVMAMHWEEIDLAAARWIIPAAKAKAGKEIDLPLSKAAMALLSRIADRQRCRCEYVFPHRFDREHGHITTCKTIWAKILADAGSADCHIHDLRHTNATYQLAAGVDIATVSEMLGHADITTTKKIYAHVIEDRKRAAAETVEQALLDGDPVRESAEQETEPERCVIHEDTAGH